MARRTREDPELVPFRQGVWLLSDASGVLGHVATIVEDVSAPVHGSAQVWLLLTWLDGRRERIWEDYPPWTSVAELRDGYLTVSLPGTVELRLTARWLSGAALSQAWARVGIQEPIGAYM